MSRRVVKTSRFKRDLKRFRHDAEVLAELGAVVDALAADGLVLYLLRVGSHSEVFG